MTHRSTVGPGYCVVQHPGTLDYQARLLFNNVNSDAARYFMQINNDTPWLKPGQLLIVADPDNTNQSSQLSILSRAKQKINHALASLNTSVAEYLHVNYDNISALTSLGDKLAGNAGDLGEKYFRQIENILIKIERTYQNQFISQGSLIGQQFYMERRALFTQLKPLLNNVSKLTLKIQTYENLKKALNLSSRSIVHEWSTVGVGAIPGYSDYIVRSSRAASIMKAGGWISLGFSFLNTSNDVYKACTVDREDECGKVAVTEYSKFGGGTLGAAGGAWAASLGTGALCGAMGIPTMGTGALVCGIVVGLGATSAGAWMGTKGGAELGEGISNLIFSGDEYMYGDLRLILLLLVFLGLFASLCFYFYFYRKYSLELSKSFHILSDKQYLDVNDYLFYEQLGLPGFAHRVFLMKRILAGKATKQNSKKNLPPEAEALVSSIYDFSWIKKFYRMTLFVVFLMLLLFLLIATGP